MRLISELRRRNVLRMAVLYVVAAWLVMQVAGVLMDLGALPSRLGPWILVALAIGFPIALVFSWFYELAPEGLSLEKDVEVAESITRVTGRRMDFIVISLLCAAVVLFAYDKWWTAAPSEQSVAVLPFVNLSGDPDQEYFSDGISEEVLNLLTKVPKLKVIARTSSFSFKGQNVNTKEIANRLGVRHLIQGSVRQSGETLRINAQLIDAADGTHKWTDTYERDVGDIFSIQDEIAASVALALGLAVSDDSLKSTKVDPEAYKQTLRARYLIWRGTASDIEAALEAARSAVAIAPQYSEAWSELSNSYGHMGFYGLWPTEEANQLAKEAHETALEINPRNAKIHSRLGQQILFAGGDLALAANHVNKALAIDPDNSWAVAGAAILALELGRPEQALVLWQRNLINDPVSPIIYAHICRTYYYASQFDEALDSCRTVLRFSPNHWVKNQLMPFSRLFAGEIDSLHKADEARSDYARSFARLTVLHTLGEDEQFEQEFAQYREEYRSSQPDRIAYVYTWIGDADSAFAWLDRVPSNPAGGVTAMTPMLKPLHDDPRWLGFIRRMGRDPEALDRIKLDVPQELMPD